MELLNDGGKFSLDLPLLVALLHDRKDVENSLTDCEFNSVFGIEMYVDGAFRKICRLNTKFILLSMYDVCTVM